MYRYSALTTQWLGSLGDVFGILLLDLCQTGPELREKGQLWIIALRQMPW